MQLTPRYDGPPVLELEVPLGDLAVPLLRQRRRLASILAGLDEEQWTAPSRCSEWCVRDVIAHLVTTNQFWAISMGAGAGGEPTRFLATFDPVATPAQLVDGMRARSSADVLADYVASVDALATIVDGFDAGAWGALAEAPPGHLVMAGVAMHALWDAWIHERDITLPLGLPAVVEDDEVIACLYYCAAIGPMLQAAAGSARTGTLGVVASDPSVAFTVECGSTVVVRDGASGSSALRGSAVDLVDGLTFRAPLDHGLAAVDAWMLGGLDEVFDRAG